MAGELRYIPVWQARNPRIRADAMAFWARLKALPAQADPAVRADEVCMAAYDGDRLVGVETCRAHFLAALDARFAFTNVLVDPDYRRSGVSAQLLLRSYYLLAGWAQTNTDMRLAGTGFVLVNPMLGRRPVVDDGFFLIGFTAPGHQLRVTWFENYRLHERDLAQLPRRKPALRWVRAWKRNDPALKSGAMAFRALQGLPTGKTVGTDISLIGYDGDRVVAVSTVNPTRHPGLGETFARLTATIDPAYVHPDTMHEIAAENFDELERWSAANPEEGWAGLMTVYEDPALGAFPADPSGLVLAGYTSKGEQIRLNWFAHARVRPERAVERPFSLSGF